MGYHSTAFDRSSSGTIVSSPGSERRIRVVGFGLAVAAEVTVKFQSDGTTDTDLTGVMHFKAGMSSPTPGDRDGWLFETKPGEPLRMVLGGSVQVGGWVNWVEA